MWLGLRARVALKLKGPSKKGCVPVRSAILLMWFICSTLRNYFWLFTKHELLHVSFYSVSFTSSVAYGEFTWTTDLMLLSVVSEQFPKDKELTLILSPALRSRPSDETGRILGRFLSVAKTLGSQLNLDLQNFHLNSAQTSEILAFVRTALNLSGFYLDESVMLSDIDKEKIMHECRQYDQLECNIWEICKPVNFL